MLEDFKLNAEIRVKKLLILKIKPMSTFKKCKIILLPTNEKAIKYLLVNPSTRKIEDIKHEYKYSAKEYQDVGYKTYHLYLVSNDKIEDRDWFFSAFYGYLIQNTQEWRDKQKEHGLDPDLSDLKFHKVIATTDESLTIKGECKIRSGKIIETKLPQPSETFIKKYIESYNKGEIITDVLVEYEEGKFYSGNKGLIIKKWLKINSKDNTITIKKVKDSWSREEVIELLKKHSDYIDSNIDYEAIINACCSIPVPSWDDDKWIEENL